MRMSLVEMKTLLPYIAMPRLVRDLRDLGIVAPQRHRLGAAADVELHHPVQVSDTYMKPSSTSGVDSSLPRSVPPVERPPIEKMNLSLRSLTLSRLTSLERRVARIVVVAMDHEPVLRLVGGVEQALRRDVGGHRRHRHGRKGERRQCCGQASCGHDLPPLRFSDRAHASPRHASPGHIVGRDR